MNQETKETSTTVKTEVYRGIEFWESPGKGELSRIWAKETTTIEVKENRQRADAESSPEEPFSNGTGANLPEKKK